MKAPPSIVVTCVGCQAAVPLELIQSHEDLTHYEKACQDCGMFLLLSFSPPRSSARAVKIQIEGVMRSPMTRKR
jgi:hypothetical protein